MDRRPEGRENAELTPVEQTVFHVHDQMREVPEFEETSMFAFYCLGQTCATLHLLLVLTHVPSHSLPYNSPTSLRRKLWFWSARLNFAPHGKNGKFVFVVICNTVHWVQFWRAVWSSVGFWCQTLVGSIRVQDQVKHLSPACPTQTLHSHQIWTPFPEAVLIFRYLNCVLCRCVRISRHTAWAPPEENFVKCSCQTQVQGLVRRVQVQSSGSASKYTQRVGC